MWIKFKPFDGMWTLTLSALLIFIPVQSSQGSEPQVIAEAKTSYHSFHSIDVQAMVFAKDGQSLLMEDEKGDLYVRIAFADHSRRSAVQSQVEIRFLEDVNYPNLPQKWVPRFERVVEEGSIRDPVSGKIVRRQKMVKIPGEIFDLSVPIHRVRLEIALSTHVKFGWASRQSHVSRVFFLSPYPHFRGRRLNTFAIQKLNTWAYAKYRVLQSMLSLFKELMDPTYKIHSDGNPHQRLKAYLEQVKSYLESSYEGVDFRAYMTEFITSYSGELEEKIEFPVETRSFLGVEDKDFRLKSLIPSLSATLVDFPANDEDYAQYLALLRLVGMELGFLEKVYEARNLAREEMERLSVFQVVETRNGYVERLNLLEKNTLKQQRAYAALGKDLKRTLGWNPRLKQWSPLERSPIFDLAHGELFGKDGVRLVDRSVIEAVRAVYYSVFFILGGENHYAKVLEKTVETAMSVFQLSPPEITFSLDNDLLFNGEDGILIARVFNPSKYLSLKNIHILVEKNNLRRVIFYRGDNLQTLPLLKPQEVRFVFFRFSCIGIGTDHPSLKVRYNQDFQTDVRIMPIAVTRKDEFLAGAMERANEFTEDTTVNSYTRLREKISSFQDRLKKSP